MIDKILAQVVFMASDIHKGSFCRNCYDKAVKEGEAKAKADPANAESYKPDSEDFHHVDIEEAAFIASNVVGFPEAQKPAELMLTHSWKESVEWAKEIVEPKPKSQEIPPELQQVAEALFKVLFGRG